jgi:hypothetical protein
MDERRYVQTCEIKIQQSFESEKKFFVNRGKRGNQAENVHVCSALKAFEGENLGLLGKASIT